MTMRDPLKREEVISIKVMPRVGQVTEFPGVIQIKQTHAVLGQDAKPAKQHNSPQ